MLGKLDIDLLERVNHVFGIVLKQSTTRETGGKKNNQHP
jgi:hypothetical protein